MINMKHWNLHGDKAKIDRIRKLLNHSYQNKSAWSKYMIKNIHDCMVDPIVNDPPSWWQNIWHKIKVILFGKQ